MNVYTTNQVLKILNISKPTLYKLIKQHKLTPVKTSSKGHYRFTDSDLFLLQNSCNPPKEINILTARIIHVIGSFLSDRYSEEEVKEMLSKSFLRAINDYSNSTLNETTLN